MSAESSGVFTLKEINRIKIIQDVIERRLETAKVEMASQSEFDHVVVNDDVEQAVATISGFLR